MKLVLKNDYKLPPNFACYSIKGILANKSLVVTKADKDHVPVLFNKDDYINNIFRTIFLLICLLKGI